MYSLSKWPYSGIFRRRMQNRNPSRRITLISHLFDAATVCSRIAVVTKHLHPRHTPKFFLTLRQALPCQQNKSNSVLPCTHLSYNTQASGLLLRSARCICSQESPGLTLRLSTRDKESLLTDEIFTTTIGRSVAFSSKASEEWGWRNRLNPSSLHISAT